MSAHRLRSLCGLALSNRDGFAALKDTLPERERARGPAGGNRIVCHRDHGASFPVRGVKGTKNRFSTFRIKIPRRLIRENDLGIIHQRPGERDTLLLPDTEFRRAMVQPFS